MASIDFRQRQIDSSEDLIKNAFDIYCDYFILTKKATDIHNIFQGHLKLNELKNYVEKYNKERIDLINKK